MTLRKRDKLLRGDRRPGNRSGDPAILAMVSIVFYAGKDLEDRDWRPTNPGLKQRGSIAIHASKGMTKAYYQEAAA